MPRKMLGVKSTAQHQFEESLNPGHKHLLYRVIQKKIAQSLMRHNFAIVGNNVRRLTLTPKFSEINQ